MSASPSLHVRGLCVSAGGHRILEMVDLTLHPGEMCALIGPSGAGKSTLIRALLGLKEPSEGSVRFGAKPVDEMGPAGYVPQEDALHRGLTVWKELAYAAELRMPDTPAPAREARIRKVLTQVGLTDRSDVRIRRLSGGQRKRVAVALELLTSPPLLILDEPTSGLDPGLESKSMKLFSEVADSGRMVLVATHAMESLDRADALCVLVKGRVAFFGPPKLALEFFRVERYAGLFHQLEKQSPGAWALSQSADYDQRRFLDRLAPGAGARHPERADAPAESAAAELDRAEAALRRLKSESGGAA